MNTEQSWDEYWNKQKKSDNNGYKFIAEFYRKYIIKRTLNYFIKTNFPKQAKLLHAGCGSGQVDTDLSKIYKITALDISNQALNIYSQVNKKRAKTVQGSIFNLPFKEKSFDGIYNLGVMEHFTKEDIQKILLEFRRVLKNNGCLVLFWPPEFGSSVTALKFIHFILNKILCKNIQLHPPEITRVKSKKQIRKILNKAGFKLDCYYFGPKDMFTHSIIVASKLNAGSSSKTKA
ncbi:MAG: class I SAM-dependent methyltransferase [Candidatus Margulisbacteria bacterium]|nr:class I SAM-dependent methyltransferase [Candidatus Margulisiibacteriota bacterium]